MVEEARERKETGLPLSRFATESCYKGIGAFDMIPPVHMAFESRFKNFRSWINTELKQNKKLKRIFYFLLFF